MKASRSSIEIKKSIQSILWFCCEKITLIYIYYFFLFLLIIFFVFYQMSQNDSNSKEDFATFKSIMQCKYWRKILIQIMIMLFLVSLIAFDFIYIKHFKKINCWNFFARFWRFSTLPQSGFWNGGWPFQFQCTYCRFGTWPEIKNKNTDQRI